MSLCIYCNSSNFRFVATRPDHRSVYECISCGLGKVDPPLTEALLKKIHTSPQYFARPKDSLIGFDENSYRNIQVREAEIKAQLKLIKNIIQWKKASVFEIGCSTGQFMSALSQMGSYVEGIEMNPLMASKAKQQGHNVEALSIEEWCKHHPDKSYDVIVCRDVIEHVNNPFEFATLLSKITNPNGKIIITTINFDFGKTIGDTWIGFNASLEHVSYMNINFIQQIFNRTGVDLTDYWTSIGPIDMSIIRRVKRRLMKFISTFHSTALEFEEFTEMTEWVKNGHGHRMFILLQKSS